MEVFPKFIIEGEKIIIGKCSFHKDMVTDKSIVKGGGWFKFVNNMFILYGSSHDFGKASIEDIKECFKTGEVYDRNGNSFLKRYGSKFQFFYSENIEILTEIDDMIKLLN